MSWLARLKKEEAPDTPAREPRQPRGGEERTGFLGSLASLPAPLQKIEAHQAAPNDTEVEATTDPDRWCWPHSDAMNGLEIDTFNARLERFVDKGLTVTDAERVADRLVIRDREYDDRRLCLECVYLQSTGRWHCCNSAAADVAPEGLASELVRTLQRCCGFRMADHSSR